jgi:hypothetical protein
MRNGLTMTLPGVTLGALEDTVLPMREGVTAAAPIRATAGVRTIAAEAIIDGRTTVGASLGSGNGTGVNVSASPAAEVISAAPTADRSSIGLVSRFTSIRFMRPHPAR